MTLQEAIAIAKKSGLLIRRKAWGATGPFVYFQKHCTLDIELDVPNMTSMPDSAKKVLTDRFNDVEGSRLKGIDPICFGQIEFYDQCALVQSDNVITSFTPGKLEQRAMDWYVFGEISAEMAQKEEEE